MNNSYDKVLHLANDPKKHVAYYNIVTIVFYCLYYLSICNKNILFPKTI